VEILDVSFRAAALRASDRPREWYPQVAVAGRSNVGKSSLLNWLFQRRLAKVAKAPGKTRTLNFFLVNSSFYVVDLPGYGYAKVAKQLRDEWGQELGRYLLDEQRLAGVVTLIDIRHGPTALDLDLQEMLSSAGRERLVVLTKADKLSRGQRATMRREVQQRLDLATLPLAVSVKAGEGRRELLAEIDGLVSAWRGRQSRGD
jgi:GTP-binding protein